MYIAKCGADGNFAEGEMVPFGPIALNPSSGVLNYGQVSKGYRTLCFINSLVDSTSWQFLKDSFQEKKKILKDDLLKA